jgi:hypothetical protein
MKKLIPWIGLIGAILIPGGLIIAFSAFIIRKLSGGNK